jgi:eukaryotic-like serine/threonine-protein kinase
MHRDLPDHEQPGYDTMSSAPVVSDGMVYTGSPDGHFYAVDDGSGAEIWKFETGAPVLSVPVASGNTLYFGSNDHHVYALDAASGHLNWKFDTGQVVSSSPVIHGDLLIIGSRSADLLALNLETGEPAWSSFYWFSWVESSGAIYDNTLYIGSSDIQVIQSLNPDNGSLNWSFDTGGSPWTTPAVTEETVFTGAFGNSNYFINHRGGFFAVDRQSGTEKWRYTMNEREDSHIYGVVSSPVVAGGMVYFGGLDSVVYGFRVDGKSSDQ